MQTRLQKRVMNYQCDSFGILHHARYLEIMEEARWLYFHENDLMDAMHERGIYHVIVNINIDYKGSTHFGDQITIETQIGGTSDKSVVFRHKVFRQGQVLAQADITNVFMNAVDNGIVSVSEMKAFWKDLGQP